jgi:translation initiation factor IF-3
LIGPSGDQLGIKSLPDALSLAREQELDLVEIAPMANPPVCKIMNYPKYLYELKQRDKEARKKATNVVIKEMKYRPKIGGGDFDTKTRKVGEFLSEGHKVKITIMFRGREVAHPELGMRILNRIAEIIGASAKMEATPKLDGRNMTMVLAPEKKVVLKPSKSDAHETDSPAPVSAKTASDSAVTAVSVADAPIVEAVAADASVVEAAAVLEAPAADAVGVPDSVDEAPAPA